MRGQSRASSISCHGHRARTQRTLSQPGHRPGSPEPTPGSTAMPRTACRELDWSTVDSQAHQKRGVDRGGKGAPPACESAPVSEQMRFQGLHPLGEGPMDAISGWGGPTPGNQQDETRDWNRRPGEWVGSSSLPRCNIGSLLRVGRRGVRLRWRRYTHTLPQFAQPGNKTGNILLVIARGNRGGSFEAASWLPS